MKYNINMKLNKRNMDKHASNLIYHCWNTELIANLQQSIIYIVKELYDNNQLNLCKADIDTLHEIILRIKVNKHLYE